MSARLAAHQVAEQGGWTATAILDAIQHLLALIEIENLPPNAALFGVALLIGEWEGKGRRV